jgi:hypothetical protein
MEALHELLKKVKDLENEYNSNMARVKDFNNENNSYMARVKHRVKCILPSLLVKFHIFFNFASNVLKLAMYPNQIF